METSFQDAMNAAKEHLAKNTKTDVLAYARSRPRRTVGERIEIAKYSIAHGVNATKVKFGIVESAVHEYVKAYRAGKFNNVPPSYTNVRSVRFDGEQQTKMQSELTRLTGENKALREMITSLLSTLKK